MLAVGSDDIHKCTIHTCIHIYIQLHTYMHACMHAYLHTCMNAYMHTCVHAYMRTCIHAYMHTCIHAYMHTCIHAYIHTYIHAYIQADRQTYIHTHIRTCITVKYSATILTWCYCSLLLFFVLYACPGMFPKMFCLFFCGWRGRRTWSHTSPGKSLLEAGIAPWGWPRGWDREVSVAENEPLPATQFPHDIPHWRQKICRRASYTWEVPCSFLFNQDNPLNLAPNDYHSAVWSFGFHPLRWWLISAKYPLSGYLGLYWASSSKHDNGFWSAYSWLRPHRVSLLVPGGSFLEAKLDTQLLEKSLGAEKHHCFFNETWANVQTCVNVDVWYCLMLFVLHSIPSCTRVSYTH